MNKEMDWLKSQYEKVKGNVASAVQPAAQPVQSGLPAVATTQGAQSTFGTAPESPGYTATGARRHRRAGTKKASRKTRKTRRRRA